MKLYAIIRIRGYAGTPWYIQDHLEKLRLKRRFNAMIYPEDNGILGRVRTVQSYVTWGELNYEGLKLLLTRLYTINGIRVERDLDLLKSKLKLENFESFVNAIFEGKLLLHKLDDYFKLPIRLHPPRGGFKGKINRPYGQKGEFGYRGEKINELIRRMV